MYEFVKPITNKSMLTNSRYRNQTFTGAKYYLIYLCIELFVLVNRISKLPSIPLPPLGANDVALITGGSSGLGLELAKDLISAHKIKHVFNLDIVAPKHELGENVTFIKCDLASSQDVDSALEQIFTQCKVMGPISVVINNAGVRVNGPLLSMSPKQVQKVFDINTFAPIRILQSVISAHTETFLPKRLSVVTVSSVLGAFGPKNLSTYSASKAASTQFHEVLSRELASIPSIRMLLVLPGQMSTGMFSDVEQGRLFVAPIVDHVSLARAILQKVNIGEEGIMCEPFYSNFGYALKALPWRLQQAVRSYTQMDEKVKA
ncbi:hypothetical protein OXX80_011959 [Metschnikowia pulcherrima]